MSTTFSKEADGAGTPHDQLQRYHEKLTRELNNQIKHVNSNAVQRNKIFKRYSSIVNFREKSERKIDKKMAQRALTLGVVYTRGKTGKILNWSTFGQRYEDRRNQNDVIIAEFLHSNQKVVSLSDDAGLEIVQHLSGSIFHHLTGSPLSLTDFNEERPWSKYVHDAWHRNTSTKKLNVQVSRRGDIVTLTWTSAVVDEGKRASSLASTSSLPKDQYTWFRGSKKWILIDFESSLSTDWPHMQLVQVVLDDAINTDDDNDEGNDVDDSCSFNTDRGSSSGRGRGSGSGSGSNNDNDNSKSRNCSSSGGQTNKKKSNATLPTPRLILTALGRQFQRQLNEDVTHQIVTRKLHQNELDVDNSAARSSMSNPRLSFLGSQLYNSLHYDPTQRKQSRISTLDSGNRSRSGSRSDSIESSGSHGSDSSLAFTLDDRDNHDMYHCTIKKEASA